MIESIIHDQDGTPAVVESIDGQRVVVRLPSGVSVHIPAGLVTQHGDGSYRSQVSFSDLGGDRQTLLEVEEALDVRTETEVTGRVRARTSTDTREVPVDADGWRQTVEVERVSINRPVDAVQDVRVEGDTTIVPIYEEVLIVQKQLVLREEVRLVTRRERIPGPESVTLRRQRVEVERIPPDPDGDSG